MSTSDKSDSEYEHLTEEEAMDENVNIDESESENSENDPDYVPSPPASCREAEYSEELEDSDPTSENIHIENMDVIHTVLNQNQILWENLLKTKLKIEKLKMENSSVKYKIDISIKYK